MDWSKLCETMGSGFFYFSLDYLYFFIFIFEWNEWEKTVSFGGFEFRGKESRTFFACEKRSLVDWIYTVYLECSFSLTWRQRLEIESKLQETPPGKLIVPFILILLGSSSR